MSDWAGTTSVGGTGVVVVLHNDAGPMVLRRADMNALPVQVRLGLGGEDAHRWRDVPRCPVKREPADTPIQLAL